MLRQGRFEVGPGVMGPEGEAAKMLRPLGPVRVRLTVLYCGLFVLSAVVLLAITNGVGAVGSQSQSASSGAGAQPTPGTVVLAQSNHYLLGSAIALVVMAVVSVAAGWVVAGRVLRPLRRMTTAARRICGGSLHEA